MDYSQFKGKPFQVISKLGVRYTGIFDSISQEDQTVCLSEVYNHGTEDRPTQRKLPGSATTLGWVRFHTESISALDIVDDHRPKELQEQQPVDPALASVSTAPPQAAPVPQTRPPRPQAPAVPDAAFDFAQGTSALQADRDARKDAPEPVKKSSTSYDKSSFWDNLTSDTARVPRHEERGRNMDTFGEAGGQPGRGGFRGRGRGQGQRGRYRGFS